MLLNGGLHAATDGQNGTSTSGNLSFNGYNSNVTLGAAQTIEGNVTTSGVNGVLIFQGAGTVGGTVGSASSSLKEVRTNGVGNVLFTSSAQQAYVDYVNYQAATVVGFNGGLNLTIDQSNQAKNQVAFNNNDGVLQINNGDLTGNAGTVVVSTTGNNLGTVTMVSGTQVITGGIGASSHAIKTLNIGGNNTVALSLDTSTANYSNTTANGDIYAQNINLNNNGTTNMSSLDMASGYNLTGTVNTDTNHSGILSLDGGTQTVTGTVGATGARLSQVNSGAGALPGTPNANSTFTANVFSDHVTNTGTGSSTFNYNVTATTDIAVDAGTTLIKGNAVVDGAGGQINITTGSGTVNGTTTLSGAGSSINIGAGSGAFKDTTAVNGDINIAGGSGTFNETAGTTSFTNLNFSGTGVANFDGNTTFTNINYAGNNATVNVASGKNITGTAITTTTTGTGTLNMLGGVQTVNATVGAASYALNLVTAGAAGAATTFSNSAAVYATTLQVTGNGAVTLDGGLVGNLSYTNNVAGEDGTVTVATGKNVMGTVTTGSNGVNNAGSQGILTMAGGTQQVSGAIGTSTAALKTINAGATSATTSLNGMTYADTVLFSGNGTVALNGANSGNAIGGLVGTADLNSGTGTLQIGDTVNLTTGVTGTQFANAHTATLTFNGSSTVTGVVGDDTAGNSTFNTINAGVAGKTVTFSDNVTVGAGKLNVSGTGEVDLNGNLTGALNYNADGTVKVADGKSISGAVTTATTNTGTLDFLGGTTLNADIGSTTGPKFLKAVNFNTGNTGSVTQAINHNVYATDVSLNGATGTISTATTAGVYDYAGATNMTTNTTTGTTYNIADGVTVGGNLTITNPLAGDATLVNFANDVNGITIGGNLTVGATGSTAINLGTAHVAVNGNVVTNGASISATVNTSDITKVGAVADVSVSAGSGNIAATGTLTMTGAEKVQINYVGSLAQSGTYNVISATGGTAVNNTVNTVAAGAYNQNESGNVKDNSFAIDTRVYTDASGNLVVSADRTGGATYAANQDYAVKSNTVGNFSNNAAAVIAGLAALGTQTGDMVQVIQKIEIDSFGYGNTAANLATQVKRLAPIANASLSEAAFGATNLTVNTIDSRVGSLRGDSVASANGSGVAAGDAAKTDGFWLKGFGSEAKQNVVGQYDGYKLTTGGVAIGADTRLNEDTLVGIAISDASTKVDQQDFRLGDSTTLKSVQLTGYGSYDISKELYIDGDVSYTSNKFTGNRATAVGRTAQASFSGNQLMARLGAGYRIALEGKSVFTPLISIESSHLTTDAYTETGAGALNLAFDSESLNRTRLGLGGRLSTEAESGSTIYSPELSIMWHHDSGALTKDTTATFTGGGSSFTTPGADVVRNTVNIGAGVAITTGKDSSVLVQYDYDTHSGYHAQTVQATGRWGF